MDSMFGAAHSPDRLSGQALRKSREGMGLEKRENL